MGKKTAAAGEVLSGDFPAAPKDSNKQDEGEVSSANLDQPEVKTDTRYLTRRRSDSIFRFSFECSSFPILTCAIPCTIFPWHV